MGTRVRELAVRNSSSRLSPIVHIDLQPPLAESHRTSDSVTTTRKRMKSGNHVPGEDIDDGQGLDQGLGLGLSPLHVKVRDQRLLPKRVGGTTMTMTTTTTLTDLKVKKDIPRLWRMILRCHLILDLGLHIYPLSLPVRMPYLVNTGGVQQERKSQKTLLLSPSLHGRLSYYQMRICRYASQGIEQTRSGMVSGGLDVFCLWEVWGW